MDALKEAFKACGSAAKFAEKLGVGASTPLMWVARGMELPVEHCAPGEFATGGQVRRWHFRPNDWFVHWPELIGAPAAPPVPVSVTGVEEVNP